MDLCQEEQTPGAAEGRYEATIWTPSCCLQGFVSSAGNLIEVVCPKTQTAGSLFLFPLFLIPGRLLYPSLTNSLANAPGDAKSETAAEVGKHR